MDIKKLREEAAAEIKVEREKEAKRKIKAHLNRLEDAKQVVKNIESEIEDLEDEIVTNV